ncbi:MAG TPA: DUF4097 family beta strand repeat-containing protein [Limnochordia bacterium]|nr:DUF4097 family beta strand repeat-containing protein [Limnochordia bacterium]
MNEERMIILKMIEEGKITAAEGAALLEALHDGRPVDVRPPADQADQAAGAFGPAEPQATGDGSSADEDGSAKSKPSGDSPVWGEGLRQMAEGVRQAGDAARIEARKAAEVTRHELKRVAAQVRDEVVAHRPAFEDIMRRALSGIDFDWRSFADGGGKQTVVDEVQGDFVGEGPFALDLQTRNGDVVVESWSQSGYRVQTTAKVKASDEAQARRLVSEQLQVQCTAEGIRVHTGDDRRLRSVDVRVWVPAALAYELKARTTNGNVKLHDLRATALEAETVNGSVRSDRLQGERAKVGTVNGSLTLEGFEFDELKMRSVNGALRLSGRSRTAELDTTNGAVHLALSAGPEAREENYRLSTTNGGIRVSLGGVNAQVTAETQWGSIRGTADGVQTRVIESRLGFQKVEMQSGESAELGAKLFARTQNGGINIEN